jgi:hypothetical protein
LTEQPLDPERAVQRFEDANKLIDHEPRLSRDSGV